MADKSERIEIYNDNHDYCGNLSRDGHLVKDKQLVLVRISIAFLRMSSTGYGWGAGQEESM